MKLHRLLTSISALVCSLLLSQCASQRQVTNAPHRTTPSKAISGVVTDSYPITYTKRSGIGAVAGSIGGAILGGRVGSGYTSHLAGSMVGSLAGGVGGNAAEGAARSRSAREVSIRAGGRSFRMISELSPPLRPGERVLVLTNVYGDALRVVRQ